MFIKKFKNLWQSQSELNRLFYGTPAPIHSNSLVKLALSEQSTVCNQNVVWWTVDSILLSQGHS